MSYHRVSLFIQFDHNPDQDSICSVFSQNASGFDNRIKSLLSELPRQSVAINVPSILTEAINNRKLAGEDLMILASVGLHYIIETSSPGNVSDVNRT